MKTGPIEMLDLLQEAATVFSIPRDTQIDKMAETYSKILGWFSMETLKKALREYLTTETRRFPRPGDLYPLAKRIQAAPKQSNLRDKTMRWYQDGMWGPCPVCDSVLEFAKPDEMKTTKIYHDVQRHKEMDVPFAGPRSG